MKPCFPGPGDPPERMGGRTFFGRIVQLFQAHFGMKQQATKDPKTQHVVTADKLMFTYVTDCMSGDVGYVITYILILMVILL